MENIKNEDVKDVKAEPERIKRSDPRYIKEYCKKWYENNKIYHKNYCCEKIRCECGEEICRAGLIKHKKTNRHMANMFKKNKKGKQLKE